MLIKRIKVSNFKSFKEVEVDLTKFNVFIGANAAGKSSFVQLFEFIRTILKNGLKNAISLQGGVEYLRNINIRNKQPLVVELVIGSPEVKRVEKETDDLIIYREAIETKYRFSLTFSENMSDEYEVTEDELNISFKYYQGERDKQSLKEVGEAKLSLINHEGRLDVKVEPVGMKDDYFTLEQDNIIPPFFRGMNLGNKQLILETPYVFLIEPALEEILGSISIYNINPTLPKRATPITGKAELEEDGSNLAIVLKNIVENQEKERKFNNLIKDILPFVHKMDVEKFADKSLLLKLKEVFVQEEYIPASLLSDGTINITALIIALYFEEKKIAIIEEPERNIHPHLISKVVEMFNDASRKKQLFITTHNPEIVKYIDFEKLFLVHRDEDGFSQIIKPIEKDEVKIFLSNDMGIDDLYIQNLLEV